LDKSLENVTPLRAARLLGVLDDAKLKELGLKDATRKLTLVTRSGKHGFRVAASAAGLGAPYFQSEEDGKVYVLATSFVSELDAAGTRLVERRFHTFTEDEADALTVETGGKTRGFEVKGKAATPTGVKLIPQGSDTPDTFAKNWSGKLFRLFPAEILGKGEVPHSGPPIVQATVRYEKAGKGLGQMELARSGTDVYARSELTAGWVKLPNSADDLLKEVSKVVTP
jgi:hypothetical protein